MQFKHPPLLIGGKAMQYYKLRNGRDYDYVIHQDDYRTLVKKYGPHDFPPNTPGVKIHIGSKEMDFFSNIGPYDYTFLKKDAIKIGKRLIASKHNLILLKSYVAFIEPEPKFDAPAPSVRKKSFRDLELLVNSL